ncbi:MAG TPA: endonuclease domain-containing protein [Thermoanaerobaculia bacterium]|nr:endonuclease domain-containing protein [Thermoanaerobaculia bacterium]
MRERGRRSSGLIPVRTVRSRAQILREDPTPAEQILWEVLRDRRLQGIKFRRQKPLSIFVADFYCAELKLVVELDGGIHSDPRQAAHDRNRDFYLRSIGCTILRIPNQDLFENRESVLTRILDTVTLLREQRS